MKKKQLLALILSASMVVGPSVGTVSFAKEPASNIQEVQEGINQNHSDEAEEKDAKASQTKEKNPEAIESPQEQRVGENDASGTKEKTSQTQTEQKEETLAEQSEDEAVQAVAGATVYLDAETGSDTGNGNDAAHAVATLGKALELAGENGIVMVTGNEAPVISTTVTLANGVTVKRDPALKDNQPVLEINGGSLTINNATVDGGKNETAANSATGSVIFMRKGTLTLNDGGKIANCWYTGVWVFTGLPDGESTFIMNGGEICNIGGSTLKGKQQNAAVWVSAGTNTYPKASFIMKDGSIHDNVVVAGAVYLPVAFGGFPQEFRMEGGSITNNKGITGVNNSGNGIFLRDGTVTMTGGTISGNSGMHGGGVYVQDYGRFTMSGGTITDNTALGGTENGKAFDGYGGGILVRDEKGASVTINGGTISGNHAKRGGGICAWGNSQLTITGGTISGNEASYGAGVRIEESAHLTMTGGSIEANTAKEWAGGLETLGTSTADITGGEIKSNTSPWGAGMFVWQTKNVTFGGTAQIKGNDAGGTGDGGGLCINSGAMNITGGTISGNTARYGAGIKVEGGTATIGGDVQITQNTAVDGLGKDNAGGGGICATGGTTNITGGTISGNTSNYGAGLGIWNNGIVNAQNAVITGNKAIADGGGGISIAANTLTLDGVTISNNEAPYASGIGIWGEGKVVMNGDTRITGNKVLTESGDELGGTVFVKGVAGNGSSFVMNSGSITDNTTDKAYGAGIVVNGSKTGATAEINGGTISGNTNAQGVSQGVYLYKGSVKNGTIKLSGEPDISDEIYLNDDQDQNARIEVTAALNPKRPIPVNDSSWTDYRTIVTYAAGLTAKTEDFTPASGSERQVIIKDENDAQNLQSLNKRSVTFREKDDVTQNYGEIYVLPKEKIAADQVPDAKKEDHELLGWKELKTDKEWNFATDTVTEDTVLYPVWKSTAKYYTVKYETGSQHATIADMRIKDGNKARKPAITWVGRTLQGWYTTADFQDGTLWDFESPVKGNMTLHAKWVLNAPTVAVDADNAAAGKVTVHTGDKVVLTATASHEAEKGITFSYTWYKDGKEIKAKATGRGVSEQNRLEVEEAGTYSVKVTADDGTLTSAQVESNSLEVVVTGHDFGEWVIVKQPTETEKGLKERTCKICNLKETEEIPAIGKPEEPKPEDPKPEDPKPEDPKPEDPKPEDPKPGTSKPGSGQKTENTTTIRKTVKSVKTGDTTGLGMAVGAMALAAGAVTTVSIRRRKRKR